MQIKIILICIAFLIKNHYYFHPSALRHIQLSHNYMLDNRIKPENKMTFDTPAQARQFCNLTQLKKGESATVMGLARPDAGHPAFFHARLMELGFFRGEKVSVIAGAHSDKDPLAVRIGNTALALGKPEAAMIYVMRETQA